MPLSIRTLGDDGLYLWTGFRLAKGAAPSDNNAEAPPLGKYLIGLSILIFRNGYIYGFVSTTAILLLCYCITNILLHNSFFALFATTLLATDPLITAQFPLTMLDSIQAVFFLLSLFFLLKIRSPHRLMHILCAGISLGLFAETKFPIFFPAVAIISMLYIWNTFRSIISLLYYSLGVIIGYLIPYIPYALMGHTTIEWLGLQKWMISFYLHTKATPTWGSALSTIMLGLSQNIFSRGWEYASHWSPAWAIITAFSVAETIIMVKKKNVSITLLGALTLIILLTYQCIPFWTRYLVLLLPLLYILTAAFLIRLPQKIRFILIALIIVSNITSTIPILFPTPEITGRQVQYNLENMFFQDLYEDMTIDSRSHLTREQFTQFAHTTLADAQIESVHVQLLPTLWHTFINRQTIPIDVTYYTRHLGPFTERHNVPIVKENGRWRIPWEWDYLIHDLNQERKFQTNLVVAKRGTIFGSDKKPLAADIMSYMIWVTPGNVDRSKETSMLTFLTYLFENHILPTQLHQRINGNTIPTMAVPLGVPPHPITLEQREKLQSYSGVTITPSYGRVNYGSDWIIIGNVTNTQYFECCSRLYSTTTYDGLDGVEHNKNALLKGADGGELLLLDSENNIVKTILSKVKMDGKDVEP